MSATDHGTPEPGAYRQVEEIVDPATRAKGSLAKNCNLRVVLKVGGESKCGTDRPSKVGSRKVRPEIRGLYGNPRPWVQRPWRTHTDANEARRRVGIFACGCFTRGAQRGDTGVNDRSGSCGNGRCARAASNARAVRAHERGAHLRTAKVEGEHRSVCSGSTHLLLTSMR
jgi:hypothetical protein